MNKPFHLHLVAGFLGSGKTTAIVNACKLLVEQGKRVGVVTNDQGKYLVDTAFFRLQDFPAVEVGGGCFCCNFMDLEKELGVLVETVKPDVIFAESVGSCADLVATVVKPMLQLQGSLYQPTSYSTFVDVRLLRMRLNDIPLPFSDGVVYIFDKQLEETNLLVINKIDLLPEAQRAKMLEDVREAYPDKVILPQNSLEPEGVSEWLELLEAGKVPLPMTSLEIDYDRYGNGERQLAWLDEELVLDIPDGNLRLAAIEVMRTILQSIQKINAPVGHIKTVLRGSEGGEAKFSFTTQLEPGWEKEIPVFFGSQLNILLNARVEIPAEDLKNLVYTAINDSAQKVGAGWRVNGLQAFHPGYPKPTFRLQ